MEFYACKKYTECIVITCQIPMLYIFYPNYHFKLSEHQQSSAYINQKHLEISYSKYQFLMQERYSVRLVYSIKEREHVGPQQPLFSSGYCSVGRGASSFNRRGKEIMIKAYTHKKKNKNPYCLSETITSAGMKEKISACLP